MCCISERRHQKLVLFFLSLLSSPVTNGRDRASGRPPCRLLPGPPNPEGWKPPAPRRFFFPSTSAPAALFWPPCRALCRAPANGHFSAGVCAHFICPSGAAFLLQSCTVALGGIPNTAVDKSTGSSSAASGVPRGSQRDQHGDPGCRLGTAQIWGLPKAQFQGEPTRGETLCETAFQGEGQVNGEFSRGEDKRQSWGSRRSTTACSFPPDVADFASTT